MTALKNAYDGSQPGAPTAGSTTQMETREPTSPSVLPADSGGNIPLPSPTIGAGDTSFEQPEGGFPNTGDIPPELADALGTISTQPGGGGAGGNTGGGSISDQNGAGGDIYNTIDSIFGGPTVGDLLNDISDPGTAIPYEPVTPGDPTTPPPAFTGSTGMENFLSSLEAIAATYSGEVTPAGDDELSQALANIIAAINAQIGLGAEVAEGEAERAGATYDLESEQLADMLDHDILGEQIDLNQEIAEIEFDEYAEIAQADFDRDVTVGGETLENKQRQEQLELDKEQRQQSAETDFEATMRELEANLATGMENIDQSEEAGLRDVDQNTAERGIFRSGIRNERRNEVQSIADLARKQTQREFNHRAETATAQLNELIQFADENYSLGAQQATESMNWAIGVANAAFDLQSQLATEEADMMMGFAQESAQYAMQELNLMYQQAQADLDIGLANTLAEIIDNFKIAASQLEIDAATATADLIAQQQQLDLYAAETGGEVDTPLAPSGSSGAPAPTPIPSTPVYSPPPPPPPAPAPAAHPSKATNRGTGGLPS